jgi:lipoyl(octanoyl) transferase
MSARLSVVDLGRQPYAEVLELQRALCRQRMAGERHEDLLLLVEHEPVVTLGRGTRASSLPLAPAELERRGLEVAEVERGGDVTYHGPGQLVGYPVLDLREHRQDLHWYLRQLEAGLIAGLAAVGVSAERSPGLTGVWTRGRKIASLGIHVKQWVTFHGFALNVSTDLRAFELIVPCGIDGVVMTSVAVELGRGDAAGLWDETREAVVTAFGETFGYEAVESGSVIPSEARALAREWVESRGEDAPRPPGGRTPNQATAKECPPCPTTSTSATPAASACRPARSSPGSGRCSTMAACPGSTLPAGGSSCAVRWSDRVR